MGELEPGDFLQLADGSHALVESIRLETAEPGETFTTYNFEVADWHTYFVAPEGAAEPATYVWVHNASITHELCMKLLAEYQKA